MSTILDFCPSNLDGIRRQAKRICRANKKLTHVAALDLVAKQAGYECYQHARKALQSGHKAPLQFSIYLSAYWRDASTKPRSNGLEVLEFTLPRALLSFLSKRQCDHAQGLEGFYVECSDHLEMRSNADSQARAKELLSRAALALQFMEATGLQPAVTKPQIAAADAAAQLPLTDHVSKWIYPETGGWLMLDEPYDHVTRPAARERRETWVNANGFAWAQPSWQGLYRPRRTVPHFVTSDADLLALVVRAVEKLPGQLESWTFRSEAFNTQYVSPAREQSGKKRKHRPGTIPGYSKNAIEYYWEEGWASRWRPNQRMALKDHKEMGWTLKRLYASSTPITAHSKLMQLQSELENWMFAEYRGDDNPDVDVDVYYGGNNIPRYQTCNEMLAALDHVHAIMVGTYRDSKPLRDQLKKLDAARKAISVL